MNPLPSPPYRVRGAVYVKAGAAALLSLGMMTLMGWLLTAELPAQVASLHREPQIWAHGVPAAESSYEGEVTTRKFVFNEYKLRVAYAEAGGKLHQGTLEFDTLGSTLDDQGPTEVRYDPAHPEQFAFGKALDLAGARWASAATLSAGGVLLVAVFAAVVVRASRDLRRTRRCARDGRFVFVELAGAPSRDEHGNSTYRYHPPRAAAAGATGGPPPAGMEPEAKPLAAIFGKSEGPLLSRADEGRALAVQSASDPAAVVLLRSDLYPFQFSAEEAERVTAEARGG